MRKILSWVLVVYIAFVFIQSLFFKFSGSNETVIIFNTIADWMLGITVLDAIAEPFRNYGGGLIGGAELIASILLFVPRTRIWGALMAFGIISGAIFFHLFTPLGVDRVIDEVGNTDGGILFFMACGVWVASLMTIYLDRATLRNTNR